MDWKDLTINPPQDEILRSYSLWPDLKGKSVKPLMCTSFGELFFVTEEPGVKHLNLIELEVQDLGIGEADFSAFISESENVNKYLMSWLIEQISGKKIQKGENQVFAFAPHPAFTGKISVEHVMPMDLFPWISICEQLRETGI